MDDKRLTAQNPEGLVELLVAIAEFDDCASDNTKVTNNVIFGKCVATTMESVGIREKNCR